MLKFRSIAQLVTIKAIHWLKHIGLACKLVNSIGLKEAYPKQFCFIIGLKILDLPKKTYK